MKYELKIAEYTIAQQRRLLKKLERSKRLDSYSKKKASHANGYQSASISLLRKEARAHHLALGFLRGRTMNDMELPLRALNKGHVTSNGLTRTAPNWERIEELVLKHGKRYFDSEQALRQAFTEFKDSWTVVDVQ